MKKTLDSLVAKLCSLGTGGYALISLASLALTWGFIRVLLGNDAVALIFVGSMILHELGHAIGFQSYGFASRIVFIPFLGAATIPIDQERIKTLSWYGSSVSVLAGPAANILLILVGLVTAAVFPSWQTYAIAFASVNASLAIFNLLPISAMDGGRFTQSLFKSMDEKGDQRIANLITLVALAFGLWLVFKGGAVFLYSFLIVFGVQRASRKDDPEAYISPQAMTVHQAVGLSVLYLAMLVLTIIAVMDLPTYLIVYGSK